MIGWLQTTLTGLSLVLAAAALVYVALDRLTDRWLLALVGVLFVGLVGQLVVGVVQLVRTDNDVSGPTFVGYLLGLVVVLPVSTWWARGEPSRAGTAVFIVAGLVIPVLLLRLDQIWTAPGA
jgi:hypothetical protein